MIENDNQYKVTQKQLWNLKLARKRPVHEWCSTKLRDVHYAGLDSVIDELEDEILDYWLKGR
jgi:hypothetical protein